MNHEANALRTEYRDQKIGLTILGSLQVIGGLLALTMAGLMMIMLLMQPAAMGATMLPAVLVYLPVGVALVVLGFGSVLCRRWARDLTLVLSSAAVVLGLFMTAMLALTMPRMLRTVSGQDDPLTSTIVAVSIATMAIFMVFLPGLYAWFYSRPSVRETCRRRDHVPRWTERIPLPLLAAVLLLSLSGVWTIASVGTAVLPIGNLLLTGAPASVLMFALGAGMIALAAGLYRRSRGAWLALMFFIVLSVGLGMWTLLSVDSSAMYELMARQHQAEVPPEVFEVYTSPATLALFGAIWIAWLGYAFFLRRYVGTQSAPV